MRRPALAILLTVTGGLGAAQTADDLVGRMGAADASDRVQALLQVAQMKHPPEMLLEPVTERLLDEAPEVRIEAAYTVFRLLVALGCKPMAFPECGYFKRTLVVLPERQKGVHPRYPDDAVYSRIQGIVVVECLVGEDGAVSRVFANTGPTQLHKAATDAVAQWRFKPATLKGQPVPFATMVKGLVEKERVLIVVVLHGHRALRRALKGRPQEWTASPNNAMQA